jgi:hypothetical protein
MHGLEALRRYYEDRIDTLDEMHGEVEEVLLEAEDRVVVAIRSRRSSTRMTSSRARLAEVHACGDLNDDDRGDDPVDDHAERRPPPCVADEVGSMPPEVL